MDKNIGPYVLQENLLLTPLFSKWDMFQENIVLNMTFVYIYMTIDHQIGEKPDILT
jgi:hypothetical protein